MYFLVHIQNQPTRHLVKAGCKVEAKRKVEKIYGKNLTYIKLEEF